ncbi:RNA 2'-phosphotransferase [Erwinia phage pEa_SNUABM_7]|uniref:RNA 2'-phosphotransferase n=1 Tax=Erwinia phage pEa_SNUABM_7 TaxID=2866695 RepID=A0AAE8BLZ2_9CAUD|nr:RNA 2'-phosphotransferase [Erwinia phage pEa_SNUABM_7]QYW04946.1 hypothetical protein pEaSNUABM7_00278 [Erwinia phage pEa_SNUABM_7]
MAKSFGVYLTFILRHRPQDIGLAMDTQGWVSVPDLLERAQYKKQPITLEMLREEVATDGKGRFQFNAAHSRIRCVQGHSVEHVILNLKPYTNHNDPLYHGTASKNVASILAQGILRGKRKHVHIATNTATAKQVGQRHGEPVVFEIDTYAMITHGYKFEQAENGVILTEHVPSRYLRLVEL